MSTYFSAYKVQWLLENCDEVRGFGGNGALSGLLGCDTSGWGWAVELVAADSVMIDCRPHQKTTNPTLTNPNRNPNRKVRAAVKSGDALFGTIDSWLIWQLTGSAASGAHVTDVSNASRTNLLDLKTRQWYAPYVELFGLDMGMMPRVASNAEVLGVVKEGPLAGVPISGGWRRLRVG